MSLNIFYNKSQRNALNSLMLLKGGILQRELYPTELCASILHARKTNRLT